MSTVADNMSITLNDSDFQCLQDQLVDLKTKNYEFAERLRRSQADFEAAKAKICSLQLKLEEQERDFEVTSTTLRREIEAVTSSGEIISNNAAKDKDDTDDHKSKYKKLLHKARELQQRYEKSVEIVQQLSDKARELEIENLALKEQLGIKQKQLEEYDQEYRTKLIKELEEVKLARDEEKQQEANTLIAITRERDSLQEEVERLAAETNRISSQLESESEERRINDRKSAHVIKELKRQLASERTKSETLQKRLQNLLASNQVEGSPNHQSGADLEGRVDVSQLSTSPSTNGHSNSSTNENCSRANNQDTNSASSWSLVHASNTTRNAIQSSSNQALNETLSLCSINSEDRETVQQPCDTVSENSKQPIASPSSEAMPCPPPQATPSSAASTLKIDTFPRPALIVQALCDEIASQQSPNFGKTPAGGIANIGRSNLLIEDQAALVERITKLQHEKWMLEEKLSYAEQANSTLSEDLANKSDIIRHYFLDQANRHVQQHQPVQYSTSTGGSAFKYSTTSSDDTANARSNAGSPTHVAARRISFPNNVNQLLLEKPSLKRVFEFIKDKSHAAGSNAGYDSESINREATKKMQLMLEETLIKCLKLQENLDLVTSELNKLKP